MWCRFYLESQNLILSVAAKSTYLLIPRVSKLSFVIESAVNTDSGFFNLPVWHNEWPLLVHKIPMDHYVWEHPLEVHSAFASGCSDSLERQMLFLKGVDLVYLPCFEGWWSVWSSCLLLHLLAGRCLVLFWVFSDNFCTLGTKKDPVWSVQAQLLPDPKTNTAPSRPISITHFRPLLAIPNT